MINLPIKRINEINFKYTLDCDYDEEIIDRDEYGYARQSKLHNLRVTNKPKTASLLDDFIDFDKINAKSQKAKLKKLNSLEVYGLDRLISSLSLDKDDFEFKVVASYYGDEIDKIYLSDNKKDQFYDKITEFKELDVKDLNSFSEWLLVSEYGFLLDKLKGRNYTVKTINYSDLNFGAVYHKAWPAKLEEYKQVLNDKTSLYNQLDLPLGITLFDGNKFRIIDGYHRLQTASDREVVKVIVAK